MLNIIPIFECEVKDGAYTLTESENLRLIKFLYGRQGKYQLYFKRPLKRKNLKYQNWYFGVALPLVCQETGETDVMRLHAVFKSMFLKQMVEIKGEVYEAVGSTQGMTSVQHSEFVEKVVAYCASELRIYLPPPNPNYNLPILIEN
mgnify:CR=1 FL=1